ncbi:MAG: DUF285 domain-containing protein [Bacteroidetes bacterium]|nr:DUF285 domain-containing protein [Bacteroidota bacterium]
MKKITLLCFLFTLALNGYAQQFITRWDLSIAGSGATQISFGVGTSGIVNYSWETIPASVTGSGTFNGSTATITSLPAGSVIKLKIDSANFNHFKMYNGTDRNRLLDIEQWGNIHWSNFSNSFYGCSNLNISAIDIPDLSNVPSLIWCFRGCTSLTGPTNISNWDVSHVAYMYGVFWDASIFNQPIGNWDVSHVITMNDMFRGASFFNQPIGNWDVSHVIEMADMFNGAATFNQPIVFVGNVHGALFQSTNW